MQTGVWRLGGVVLLAVMLALPARGEQAAAFGPHPPASPAASESLPITPAEPRAASSGDSEAKPLSPNAAVPPSPSLAWPLAVVLGLVIAGVCAARMLGRRAGLAGALGPGGKAPSGVLEILGRYPVGRGSTLVLLKIDRRVLLLSQSAGGKFGTGAGFRTLCEITDPEEVASLLVRARDDEGDSMAARFRSLMTRFDDQHARAEAAPGGMRPRPSADQEENEPPRRARIPVVDVEDRVPVQGCSTIRTKLEALRGKGVA